MPGHGPGVSAMVHRIFFSGPQAAVHGAVLPYADAADHLGDELRLCDLLLEQLPARRAQAAARDLADDAAAVLVRLTERAIAQDRAIGERVTHSLSAGIALPIAALAERTALDPVNLQLVLLALAIELEPRRLRFSVEAGEPGAATAPPPFLTPSLAFELLAGDQPRHVFLPRVIGPDSALARRLLLRADEGTEIVPLASAPLRCNPFVSAFVLGQAGCDPLLAPFIHRMRPPPPAGLEPDEQALTAVIARPAAGHCLWLVGSDRLGVRELVHRIAGAHGQPVAELDLDALAAERATTPALRAALRLDQQLTSALVLLRWPRGLDDAPHRGRVLRFLQLVGEEATGPIVTWSEDRTPELAAVLGSALAHKLQAPSPARRRTVWSEGLAAIGSALPASQVERLAGDFALGPGEIADIVSSVQRLTPGAADYDGLRRACVARLQGRLGRLADLVVTHFRWDDLVLPDEDIDRLWEIVVYQQYRQQVFSAWNLVSKLPYGGGIAALFSGPPGTGKTMAASVIANALGRELHRVDLSRVVDKYIGETEKNLGGVFDAAAAAGAVLLFDEADALFAKRTAVSSSNDRYANLETNFLLQRIEAHAGVTLLTTNNPRSIDEAFLRRIQFKVEFPFPDPAMRARLWIESLPAELPLAADVQPDVLGARFELAGGHIRAAVLRAAYRAAVLGQPVSQRLLAEAALVELEGLGKLIPAQQAQRPR